MSKRGFGTGAGYPRKYEHADDLMYAFEDYCDSVDENPDLQDRVASGSGKHTELKKRRPYLLEGFCIYIGIAQQTWYEWKKKREDLREVIDIIDATIKADKIEGAYTERYNPVFAARHMGLAEQQEVRALVDATPAAPTVASEHEAIHIHPSDPDPLNTPRPLYSRAQIDAGIPFHDPWADTRSAKED